MVTRRSFVLSGCCALSGTGALFPIIGSVAKENTKEFICATIDTVNVQATEFEMVPFGGAGKDKSFSIDTTRNGF